MNLGSTAILPFLFVAVLCEPGMYANDSAAGVRDLGVMDGFYRYRPVLGEWTDPDYAVRTIPPWMFETSFPYVKRPTDREIDFADGLTCVRLLGTDVSLPGTLPVANPAADTDIHPRDLVFRDKEGKLQYRWNLLETRLDPYVALGYTDLTLVLDNVPWCLAEKPVSAKYGQIAPPSNFEEWREFVAALCREMKRRYGGDAVKHFRFRMGTEMQDHRRFSGTFEDYLKYYDYAADAVKSEIPEAGFGPFNRSDPVGPKGTPAADAETVSIVELARHALNGKNAARGGTGSPFDFFARSFYFFSSQPQPGFFQNIHPDERVSEVGRLWDKVSSLDPRFAGISREVHEFGPHIRTEEGLYGLDTGARGAAQTFHTLMDLKGAGVNRVWHWDLFEDFDKEKTHSLLMGQGWLYSVLDHMRGAELYIVPVEVSGGGGNVQKAALAVQPDRAILVVANWNPDRTKHETVELTVRIPDPLLHGKAGDFQMLSFNEETSVYDVLRRDLAAAGLLSEKHLKHRGAPATTLAKEGYDSMADPVKGRDFLEKSWPKYEMLMRNSLQLGPFKGRLQEKGGMLALGFSAASPSVTVIVFRIVPQKQTVRLLGNGCPASLSLQVATDVPQSDSLGGSRDFPEVGGASWRR